MATPVPALDTAADTDSDAPDGAGPDPTAGPACDACPHERDAHDANGTRFCAATAAASLDRGCICVGEARRSVGS